MPDRPHLAFPVRLGHGGRLQAFEQGSDEDIANSIGLILAYAPGQRRGYPDFGVFVGADDVDTRELTAAISTQEPRAASRVDLVEEQQGIARLTVGFDPL